MGTMISIAQALEVVECSKDHRVLRRLVDIPIQPVDGQELFRGLYVDCEATGLDIERDEIVELGAIPFDFDVEGHIISAGEPFHTYREPSLPISAEASRVNKITDEKVKGCRTDPAWADLVESADLIVAHNAGYDRPMIERMEQLDKFVQGSRRSAWACSQTQVPWKEHGFSGSRLEYLLSGMGYFYDAHGAVEDCKAGLFALTWPINGRPALSYLLDASRKVGSHVWAYGAPFEVKDELKRRGYFWDADKKVWHKEVLDLPTEEAWLAGAVYRGRGKAVVTEVTARDRFTKRG
jgi:DNA polymerase-3 subunit epsilon